MCRQCGTVHVQMRDSIHSPQGVLLRAVSFQFSCIYGSDSWTFNKTLLNKLESFQAEVGKHILQLPKSTSNTIPLLALNWPTMCARILCSKISYLLRICNDQKSTLKSQTFNTIAALDVHSLELVKQCKFLASLFESLNNLTEEVLGNSNELLYKVWEIAFSVQIDQMFSRHL